MIGVGALYNLKAGIVGAHSLAGIWGEAVSAEIGSQAPASSQIGYRLTADKTTLDKADP